MGSQYRRVRARPWPPTDMVRAVSSRSRRRTLRQVLSAAPVALALTLLTALGTTAPAAGTPVRAPHPAGPSPSQPDPHPPLGGRAPNGDVAGGAQLLRRTLVRAPGSPALPASITAAAFMVTDLDSGQILAARDAHGRYQPASVLKLLTAVTILPALAGRRVLVADNAAANAEGSAVGLVPGGRYTVDTLFRSLLLMSGNDAARVLADAAGGVNQTVAAMNARAGKLGAYDTLVETPSGLDGWHQLSSAYDLTVVLRAAVHSPRLLAYAESPTARLPAQKVGKRTWRSVPLFNESQNFYDNVPGAILAKTGFTDAAQHTYACATERGGRRIGVVMLRAQRHPLDQWQQAQQLLAWAYRVPPTTRGVGMLGQLAVDPPLRHTGASRSSAGRSPTGSAASAPASTVAVQGVAAVGHGLRRGTVLSTIAVFGTAAAALLLGRRRRQPRR